jgi:voltage-gated potassium channel
VLVTAVALRNLAPDLQIWALAGSAKVAQALRDLGATHTLSADDLVGHTIAKSLEAPHAGDLLLRMVDSDSYRIEEVPVDRGDLSRPLSRVRPRHPGMVLGLVHGGSVTLGIDEDPVVASDDRLLILGGNRHAERAA